MHYRDYSCDVSVVIPIYKGEKFLKKTLNSILNQNCTFKELILVDDNSPDNSWKIIYEFFDNNSLDFDLKIVRHKKNHGAAYSYTHGAFLAESKYVIFFDQDDIAMKNMVETLYKTIIKKNKEDKRYVIVVGGVIQIDENDDVINDKPIIGENFSPDEFLARLLVRNRGCRTGGMIVDANVFKNIGGFNPKIKSAMDWELCVRLTIKGYLVYFLDKPLLFYRRHKRNITSNVKIGIEDTRVIYRSIGLENVVKIVLNGFKDKCEAFYNYMMMFSLPGLNDEEFKAACKKAKEYYDGCKWHKDFLFLLSVCALKEEDLTFAYEILNRVLSLDKNYASALNNLGCLEAMFGNWEKAKKLLNKALELYPNYMDAKENLEIVKKGKTGKRVTYHFTYRPLRKTLTTYGT